MKIRQLGMTALLVAMLSFLSYAASAAEMIAIVDMQRVLRDSKATKSIDEQMKKIRDSYQAEITRQEEALRKEDQKLNEQRSLLSAEAFAEKEKAFKKKLAGVQRDIQEKRASLDNAFKHAINTVQEKIYKIIEVQAKAKGFKVALPSSETLYVDTGLDITPVVITQLDKDLPRVTVSTK